MRRPIAALLAVALLATASATAEELRRPKLDDFQIHQYVASRALSPDAILRLDTNAEILMACRQPRTRADLAAMDFEFTESQLVLLRVMRMLGYEDGSFETLIPLLGAEDTARLRAATAALAAEIVADSKGEVAELRQALVDAGAAEHVYAVLFSYLLDGMAWQFFEEYEEVRPRRLSVSRPHWAGEIWGTLPAREPAATTRSILAGELAVRVTRPLGAESGVDSLLGDWRDLRALLARHAGSARRDDEDRSPETAGAPAKPKVEPLPDEVVRRLAEYGVVDEGGAIAVPVLVEKRGEKVFEIAQGLVDKVTAAVREKLGLQELGEQLGLRNREQTLIVAYHELMWDLMDAWETAGLVSRPPILADPGAAGRAEVAAVVFVVDSRREEAAAPRDTMERTRDDE